MVLCKKNKYCFLIVVRPKKKERVKLIVLNFLIHTLIHSNLRTVQFDNPIVSHCVSLVSEQKPPKKKKKKKDSTINLSNTRPLLVCILMFGRWHIASGKVSVIQRHTRCKLWDKTNTKIPIAKISL